MLSYCDFCCFDGKLFFLRFARFSVEQKLTHKFCRLSKITKSNRNIVRTDFNQLLLFPRLDSGQLVLHLPHLSHQIRV